MKQAQSVYVVVWHLAAPIMGNVNLSSVSTLLQCSRVARTSLLRLPLLGRCLVSLLRLDVHSSTRSPDAVLRMLDQVPFVSCSGVRSIIKLLTLVVAYSLWRERNHRIFRQISSSEAATISRVDRSMRDRLLSLPPPRVGAVSLLQLYFSMRSLYPP
ncbi:hypothetical protein Bca101_075524 [Brassica carinata]